MAVGITSLEDCPRLTWSLGCTKRDAPRSPPSNSLARFASTSFMFMLVCVPEPVCHTSNGNSSSCLPAITSCAAAMIASACLPLSKLRSRFTLAAAALINANARNNSTGMRSWDILKCSSERCVWAPQYRVAATLIVPKVSRSSLSLFIFSSITHQPKQTDAGIISAINHHDQAIRRYFAIVLFLCAVVE